MLIILCFLCDCMLLFFSESECFYAEHDLWFRLPKGIVPIISRLLVTLLSKVIKTVKIGSIKSACTVVQG